MPSSSSVTAEARRLAGVLQARLGQERRSSGGWEGRLASSALSTATAVCALGTVARYSSSADNARAAAGENGQRWLAKHANADGGWGDTTRSVSNLSTTMLVWSAFGISSSDAFRSSEQTAAAWIQQKAGSLEPGRLARALAARYGRDRTFSVPILATAAIAGRLGAGTGAWRHVPALPFELAALPRHWFGSLRLPVVSYALPALIALGQLRHFHAPSPFAPLRWIRNRARRATLNVLTEIQPVNGGFLEATPLTSFVALSLAAGGNADHEVARRAVGFLLESQRDDGSWPIDTNLSVWLTSLSVDALGAGGPDAGGLAPGEAESVMRWLERAQFQSVHPYTGAAAGGWAWTDLPGGVPDADDTAGALIALRHLGRDSTAIVAPVEKGIAWLLDLQNDDGGIPTFCRGWGTLPFDRSGPDLTAHALRAWCVWERSVSARTKSRIQSATRAALRYLARTQRADGSWVPLWFGNEHSPTEENQTYGTSRVIVGLATATAAAGDPVARMIGRGVDWLMRAQLPAGGWSGFPGGPPSIEETALAVDALAAVGQNPAWSALPTVEESLRRGVQWLIEHQGEISTPAPIGFYFARLWYYEELYPLIFCVRALKRFVATMGP